MTSVSFDNTVSSSPITIDELTNSSDTGVFDVMLARLSKALKGEYDAGRITGAAYASAYTSCINDFIAHATDYALAKAKLALELELLQAQLVGQNDDNALKEYELNVKAPIELQTIQAQLAGQTIQNQTAQYELDHIEPQKLALLVSQVIGQGDDNALKEYELTTKAPAELAMLQAQTANQSKQTELANFDLVYLEPQKLSLIENQVLTEQAQIRAIDAKTALDTYELTNIEPQKLALGHAQLNLQAQQLVLTQKQIDMQQAQNNLYTQKVITERAQTDASVIGYGSVLATQNQLYTNQANNFVRDAEQKAASVLLSTWSVRANADPTSNKVTPDNKLQDPTIGAVVQKLLAGVGVSV